MFGNYTKQASPAAGSEPNGFIALAAFDETARGGNSDGVIDARDGVFAHLRLWLDTNHNGLSEPGELHPLASLAVETLSLDYKESRRTDEHGNGFKYRAKVGDARGAHVARWAWDVNLLGAL